MKLPKICPERERLTNAYAEAIREYNRLTSQRLSAKLHGDDPPAEALINNAHTNKENAKYALMGHVNEHGCGGTKP